MLDDQGGDVEARRLAAPDPSRAANRLSGFFSQLLRREQPIRDVPSRTESPAPPRSATPPPTLPPPSLLELGLSLSEITADLSPNPPSSGAFLAPHYLLLCHSQGLDVLPIISPPAPHPYALIRRVSFKSVVVMEHRGVLVAVAGRRDGVRVYALEEVKKAIEWRMDVEMRRERDRQRREDSKKVTSEKPRRASLSTPPSLPRSPIPRKASTPLSFSDCPPVLPLMPRPPVPRSPTRRSRTPHFGHPPAYVSSENIQSTNAPVAAHARNNSLTSFLTSTPPRPSTASGGRVIKTNWEDSSDDEAIDIVAAGASGSQALDERTSATRTATADSNLPSVISSAPARRRSRPANLDLSLARPETTVVPGSPAPTLLTLRHSLSNTASPPSDEPPMVDGEMDDEDEDNGGPISLAQALLESRIPDLPPIGTRRPQQPILIPASHSAVSGDEEPASPRTSEGYTPSASYHSIASRSQGRRSLVLPSTFARSSEEPDLPFTAPPSRDGNLTRSSTFRSTNFRHSISRPSTAPGDPPILASSAPDRNSILTSRSSRSSRFLTRILSSAFNSRRSEDYSPSFLNEMEPSRRATVHLSPSLPPPKLEYVKLPGTKGSLLVKAVETPKKRQVVFFLLSIPILTPLYSFLAILCGENGEKVELFAGTYRTALGLSRTFILPDSPRSLELQLQGDDLVEVFLVFSQNVFGLEPATVRVREVRIGRAERRAARRRAREMRTNDATLGTDLDNAEEEANVSVNVSVTVGSSSRDGSGAPPSPALIPTEHPNAQPERQPSPEPAPTASQSQAEELVAVATAHMGPYTTFQQLTFAPKFPLASIADEYVIPPTYPDFIEYRDIYEPDVNIIGNASAEQTQLQFSPPGLPVPAPAPPSKWYYRDPKGVMHGMWIILCTFSLFD